MTLPIRIVVRTDTDWDSLTLESFSRQSGLSDINRSPVRVVSNAGMIQAWQEAYGIDYFMYRSTIRKRCESVLRSLGHAVSVGVDHALATGAEEILCPIDDDDLFSGSLGLIAPVFGSGVNLVLWKRRTVFHGVERIERNTPYLDTCNWAIRRSFLMSMGEHARECLLNHMAANRLVHAALGIAPTSLFPGIPGMQLMTRESALVHESVINLDACYSWYYLHSGSISYLGVKVGHQADMVAHLRSLPLHPLWGQRVPT